jgi:hypothetical protein
MGLFKVYEETATFFVAHMKFGIATLGSLFGAVFFGIEVILAGFASQNLAIFGDLEALQVGFVGLDRHGCRRSILRVFEDLSSGLVQG